MKKFIMALAFFAASMATVTTLSSWDDPITEDTDPGDDGTGGGPRGGCYTTGIYKCVSSPYYDGGDAKYCDFTGTYGAPTECTEKVCARTQTTRRCVKPA